MQPKKRSELRIMLGKRYYTYRRYLNWYFGSKNYAQKRETDLLPLTVFTHQTPLIRKLRNVDMQLQYNKIKNLKLAVSNINGIIIEPGEAFSYWRLIGKPTRAKGYLEGMVLFYGTFTPGVGGGLCQLSNLIYWMTLHTPLTITERHRHSFDVFPDVNRSQPFGSGATCFYNYLDLQIRNDTEQSYQLRVYLTDKLLVGEWCTQKQPLSKYEVYEKDHWISHEYWGGYLRHNTIYRKVSNLNGDLLDDEFITENHAIMMYEPFLAEGYSNAP
ncbi:VanW family protein [Metallumcola ferriviriculae]|uniref:VanW family protein n=1 Tax=Metallumcola ferriviriculae TaxID=3039180 RepID=A0AAU0UTV9_9FIRM|nr:VanW family protein [Desulfitibacteraceae bacterium MK1]